MEATEKSNLAKQFNAPEGNKSGLYIFRSGSFGGALKKDVWLDGKCLGETAPNTFFYEKVAGTSEHKLSTESEFSPNDLVINMEAGKNYFVRQYIKFGIFVGGAGLEIVNDAEGKKEISGLEMAVKGTCSK